MRRCLVALALAMTSAQALAQTGSSGPSTTAQAGANAAEADKQTKASNTPAPAGASILISSPSQSENCALPISLGYGSLITGFTVVWARSDPGCEARRDAYALGTYAGPHAALQRLCLRKENRLAMKAAGTPCTDQH